MSTSQSLPDDRDVAALAARVSHLEMERLGREMEEGYRFEAETPSLEPEWAAMDADGF